MTADDHAGDLIEFLHIAGLPPDRAEADRIYAAFRAAEQEADSRARSNALEEMGTLRWAIEKKNKQIADLSKAFDEAASRETEAEQRGAAREQEAILEVGDQRLKYATFTENTSLMEGFLGAIRARGKQQEPASA